MCKSSSLGLDSAGRFLRSGNFSATLFKFFCPFLVCFNFLPVLCHIKKNACKPHIYVICRRFNLELVTGLEPATCSLRMSCTTNCATQAYKRDHTAYILYYIFIQMSRKILFGCGLCVSAVHLCIEPVVQRFLGYGISARAVLDIFRDLAAFYKIHNICGA